MRALDSCQWVITPAFDEQADQARLYPGVSSSTQSSSCSANLATVEQPRTCKTSPGANLPGNPGLRTALIVNPLHTLSWANGLAGLQGSLHAFLCLLVWLCCPGMGWQDAHELSTTGTKVEKAVRSWRCCKQWGEKWCKGLFRLCDTRQGQHAIFLDSTRICLDSAAERKEKIHQNSWLINGA